MRTLSFKWTAGVIGLLVFGGAAEAQPTAVNRQLIGTTRVTLTQYDYVYRIGAASDGAGYTQVTATVTSSSPNAVVIAGNLTFPDVPVAGTVPSTNTFTIRQDRRYPLDPSSLTFTFSAKVVHGEILVVYNTNYADSLTVAHHYMTQRNIPAANLCAISPPANDVINPPDYPGSVQKPIQNCLHSVGQQKVLYIVFSYLTPFAIAGLGALDSYVADVWDQYVNQPIILAPNATHPYYADSQAQGNVYQPFVSFYNYRSSPGALRIYSVWRLDAPTLAMANALVDQAIHAEGTGGPIGQACIDREFGDIVGAALPDSGYFSGDWDLRMASAFLQQAGISVTEDSNVQEFGTPPAPLTCPNTALYSGWYSLNHYNDAFTWQTGSIGWHLDSASAISTRGGASWVPNALQRGIAVTSGSVLEPYLEGLVRPGGAYRNLLEGARVGDAFLRNTRWLKWMILNVGDPVYRPFGAGRAPFSPLQPVNSFALVQKELVGGGNATGTIVLSAPAGPGGVTFTLDKGGASFVRIPPSVTVSHGMTSASFPIATSAVSQSQSSVITASGKSLTLRNTVIVDPLLGAVAIAPIQTSAGLPVTGYVLLNDNAPPGGVTVHLSSDIPSVATVPGSVVVPGGAASASFTVSTSPVRTAIIVNIGAAYAGATTSAPLGVVPAITGFDVSPSSVPAGSKTTLEIGLASPAPAGGAKVRLSSSDPASLPVPVTLVVAQGATYANTILTSSAAASGKSPVVTATYGGATAAATLTIQ